MRIGPPVIMPHVRSAGRFRLECALHGAGVQFSRHPTPRCWRSRPAELARRPHGQRDRHRVRRRAQRRPPRGTGMAGARHRPVAADADGRAGTRRRRAPCQSPAVRARADGRPAGARPRVRLAHRPRHLEPCAIVGAVPAAVDEAARVAAPGAALFVFTFSRHTLPLAARRCPESPSCTRSSPDSRSAFVTREQLLEEMGRVGFVLDGSVPFSEHNLPRRRDSRRSRPGHLRGGLPVRWRLTALRLTRGATAGRRGAHGWGSIR